MSEYKPSFTARGIYESFDINKLQPQDKAWLDANYEVTATGDMGCDTFRDRFRVVCKRCNKVLHENTTGPECRIKDHEREGC